MTITREEIIAIAHVVHAANCAWNIELKDRAPDSPWETLPSWHQLMVIERVEMILEGHGPETIHDAWVDLMIHRGWELGDVKDPAADPPVHPCLKDWRLLPAEQQKKDTMAIAIVKSLAGV